MIAARHVVILLAVFFFLEMSSTEIDKRKSVKNRETKQEAEEGGS